MPDNKHTPEPLAVKGAAIRTADGIGIDVIATMQVSNQPFWDEDARRIIACVNACEGIPTYQLTGEDENPVILGDMIDLLRKQRDELLAALEKMNRAYVILMESARDRICDLGGECDGIEVMERNDPYLRESRATIASVKGEQ